MNGLDFGQGDSWSEGQLPTCQALFSRPAAFDPYMYFVISLQTNATPPCNPSAIDWYHSHAHDKFSCITSCQGVYADVNYHNESTTESRGTLFGEITRNYSGLKDDVTENFQFQADLKGNDLRGYGKLEYK